MGFIATAAPAPARVPARPASVPEAIPAKPKRPRHHTWLLLAAVIAIIAAFVVRSSVSPSKKQTRTAAVRTAVVQTGAIEQTLRLAGRTVALRYSTLLTPQLWGVRVPGSNDFPQVLEKLLGGGSRVHKGDIVAEFDRLYMLNRMDDYRAWVAQHRNNVKKLYANLEVKRRAYEQQIRKAKADRDKAALDLQKAPVLSSINIEKYRLSLEEGKARYQQIVDEAKYVDISEIAAIRGAELDLRRCDIEFNRAQRNVDRMVVPAPMDGLVVMQTIRRGSDTSEIQQGDQLSPGQPFMQIVDLSTMSIEADLNQVDAEQVRVSQKAQVRFDAYPGLELPAHVTAVTAFARSQGWRGNYVTQVPIRLQFDKLDPRVIPNFSVSVDLILGRSADAPVIPLECVFQERGKSLAYVKTPSGWEKRDVQLGMANNVAAAVVSGLRAGDVVAAEPPAHVIVP
jgi:membrane fusion protein (multidrug efflux system)